MRKLSAKWVPKCLKADQKLQRCQSSEQHLEFFSARSKWFPVRRDWWPWTKPGYITMTRRQSNNQWSGGIAAYPAPNIPSAKIRWKPSRLDFFGIKTASSSLIVLQRAKLSTRSITHLCWCNWRTFWRKNVAERECHQGGIVLARQCPDSTGTCHPEETGLPGLPISLSPTLFSGSGPVILPPVPWTEKNNWKVAIFYSTRRSLLPRRPGWTDNVQNFFFWVAYKS